MSCTPCIDPARATIAFFPGTQGPAGPAGAPSTVPGPTGPAGAAGAIGVYVGTYVSNGVYNDTAYRRDIVDWSGGYWITNNTAKNGLATWSAPTVDDWAYIGDTFINVATALRLNEDTNIAVGINIQAPGFIKSDNFDDPGGIGWVLTPAGALVAYNAKVAGVFSTNSLRFNVDRPSATMPAVAYAEFPITAIADGAIPENPTINNVTDDTLIFFGWGQSINAFLENRFGNTQQKFTINLEGTGSNTSGGTEQFFIQIYYRTRLDGGAWDPWTVIGQDWYMNKLAALDQSFQLVRDLSIALVADNDIQFSAGFSKGVGGTAAVAGAKISVKAYN